MLLFFFDLDPLLFANWSIVSPVNDTLEGLVPIFTSCCFLSICIVDAAAGMLYELEVETPDVGFL